MTSNLGLPLIAPGVLPPLDPVSLMRTDPCAEAIGCPPTSESRGVTHKTPPRNDRASPQTRALATAELVALKAWLAAAAARTRDPAERAHLAYGEQQIAELQKDPKQLALPPSTPPDGPPIGSALDDE